MLTQTPRIIVIGGPTASGKTALAIDVALKLGTEIINADSRQIYQELNIGVAKPTLEELNRVKHHFVNHVSIHTHYSAGDFQREAQLKLKQLINQFGSAVICGGTGLYIKALLEGLDTLPEVAPELREEIENQFQTEGLTAIQQRLLSIDANAGNLIALDNPARVKRALELVIQGKTSLENIFNQKSTSAIWPQIDYYCIDWPREELYHRINIRVDQMIEMGLEAEVRDFFEFRTLKSLQTVGYSEWFDHFEGKISKDEAIALIKQHTRNYAKRQITWFKNQFSSKWILADTALESIFA